ncbi:hypothetical protein FQZ97_519810 [compost metagenome]
MRASATSVEGTVLLPDTVRGFTTPEKRMYSVPWLMPICFSPLTSRLPLAMTSVTVTVITPLKVLLALAPPLALSVLVPDSLVSCPSSRPPMSLGMAANTLVVLPVRLALAPEFLVALTFSLMRMVRMSPTLRGRRSSNSALAPGPSWKIAPGARRACTAAYWSARAVIGWCTSGSRGTCAQPAASAATSSSTAARRRRRSPARITTGPGAAASGPRSGPPCC